MIQMSFVALLAVHGALCECALGLIIIIMTEIHRQWIMQSVFSRINIEKTFHVNFPTRIPISGEQALKTMCSRDSSAIIYHLALISEQAPFTVIQLTEVMQIPAQGDGTITQVA